MLAHHLLPTGRHVDLHSVGESRGAQVERKLPPADLLLPEEAFGSSLERNALGILGNGKRPDAEQLTAIHGLDGDPLSHQVLGVGAKPEADLVDVQPLPGAAMLPLARPISVQYRAAQVDVAPHGVSLTGGVMGQTHFEHLLWVFDDRAQFAKLDRVGEPHRSPHPAVGASHDAPAPAREAEVDASAPGNHAEHHGRHDQAHLRHHGHLPPERAPGCRPIGRTSRRTDRGRRLAQPRPTRQRGRWTGRAKPVTCGCRLPKSEKERQRAHGQRDQCGLPQSRPVDARALGQRHTTPRAVARNTRCAFPVEKHQRQRRQSEEEVSHQDQAEQRPLAQLGRKEHLHQAQPDQVPPGSERLLLEQEDDLQITEGVGKHQ